MWTIINRFFRKIETQPQDNIPAFQNYYNLGREFLLIRYGIYRNSYFVNRIYITPFNTPVICRKIYPTLTYKDSLTNFKTININISRINLFKKYGPFDYLKFSPICSAAFYKYDTNSNKLIESGIINNTDVYIYNSYFDKYKYDLNKTTYFNTDNFYFDPISVDPTLLSNAFITNLTNIQFLLASTGFIRLKYLNTTTNIKKLDQSCLKYSDINTLERTRRLFINTKSHALGLS